VIVKIYGKFGDFERFWSSKNKPKQSQYAGLWLEILNTKPESLNKMDGSQMKKLI